MGKIIDDKVDCVNFIVDFDSYISVVGNPYAI